jgi:transcriptional regulator with XRE-family HTH domain
MNAKELELMRLRAGRTQTECGAALGITRQAYAMRELGTTPISDGEAETLRAFLVEPAGPAPLTIPEQLRGARALAGRTIAECARALGLSTEAYRSREAGAPALTQREMDILAALFGYPRDQVFRRPVPKGPRPAESPQPLAKTLTEQLRYWRGVAGFSTEEAGDAIGVHRNGYSAREAGTAQITGPELALLAKAYKRPLFDIFPAYEPTEGELLLCRALLISERIG